MSSPCSSLIRSSPRAGRIIAASSAHSPAQQKPEGTYAVKVAAKKRSIDPLVQTSDGLRRFTTVNADYAAKLAAFRADDFDRWVWAKYE